ncbi:MAG: hypothetical protein IVW55_13105 [Chloroflexi bacterium]|nr:hypothetical protein [Chloroflexota bacterium]
MDSTVANEGRITGKPTLMAIYPKRLAAEAVLAQLGDAGYPLADVSVYYRLGGTTEVLDAVTGQVAAGQSLNDAEITPQQRETSQTVVLLHPSQEQFGAVQTTLLKLGEADIKYSDETLVQGSPVGQVTADDAGKSTE